MAVSLRRPSIKGVIDLKPDHGRKMRPTNLKSAYLHRVSYISAHVLLNLLNELGKNKKMRVCNCSMFCCALLYVYCSIAIILMGKRELITLLNLSSWYLLVVGWLFLAVPRGCLQFVIVVFPDHTHLLFLPQQVK